MKKCREEDTFEEQEELCLNVMKKKCKEKGDMYKDKNGQLMTKGDEVMIEDGSSTKSTTSSLSSISEDKNQFARGEEESIDLNFTKLDLKLLRRSQICSAIDSRSISSYIHCSFL